MRCSMKCSYLADGGGPNEPCGNEASSAWIHRAGAALFYCPRHAVPSGEDGAAVFGRAGYSVLSMDEYAAWRVLSS